VTLTLIDDHRVLDLLTNPRAAKTGGYATTCSWWWRLASALSGSRRGALSRRTAGFDPAAREALLATVGRLREHLVIVDLGDLIPAMAVLSRIQPLNQLAAEAIVAAEVLEAPIEVAIDTPPIRSLAATRGVPYRVV